MCLCEVNRRTSTSEGKGGKKYFKKSGARRYRYCTAAQGKNWAKVQVSEIKKGKNVWYKMK